MGHISLIVALLVATISCGFLPPFNSSALVINSTNYVSSCGFNVLTFTARDRQPFYFDLILTPVLDLNPNVNFVVNLALFAPSTLDTSLNAFDPDCLDPTRSCRSNSTAGCTISVVCGDITAQWYAYVQSTSGTDGDFAIDIQTRAQAQSPALTINQDFRGDAKINVQADFIDLSLGQYNAFDFYTFTIPTGDLAPIPGSSLEILIYSADAVAVGKYNTYLYYGGFAFPNGGCIGANGINRTFLEPCEVAQGGTWGFTVERFLDYQNYSLFAYIMPGVVDVMAENVQTQQHSLRTVKAAAYFRYDVPAFIADDNRTQAQLTFVIENIIGGTLRMDVYANAAPGALPCGSISCTSLEGCHIPIPYCRIQTGFYTVVVTAVTVNDPFFPVYFTVLGRTRQVPTIYQSAGSKWSSTIKLSEYDHYAISNPGGENWLDIELYVDSDINDIPATMYIGYLPFPNNDERNRNDFGIPVEGLLPVRPTRRNEFPSCVRNYNQSFFKRCTADRVGSSGFLRLCFLQLDPCELQRFPDGVFLTVFNNGQFLPLHTWTQNPFSYTVYTHVWSPHEARNTIVNGIVRTDHVHNDLRKAYVIGRGEENLRVTLSANFHEVNIPSSPESGLLEIQYEIVYSQRNVGPWCNTCYRTQSAVNVTSLQTLTFDVPRCVENNKGTEPRYNILVDEYVYLVIKGVNNLQARNYTQNRFVITAKSLPRQEVNYLREGILTNQVSRLTAFAPTEYWILSFEPVALYNHILSVKFSAHPRAHRRLTLKLRDPRGFNPFCADDNWRDVTGPNCKKSFEVKTFTCEPSDLNKGYCVINFQICNLTSLKAYGYGGYYGGQEVFDILDRIFLAEVAFTTDSTLFGAGFQYNGYNESYRDVGLPVEYGYSLTYNLVPQVPTKVSFDVPILAELREQEYTHFEIDISKDFAQGNYYFIIEAFFDSDDIFMDQFNNSKTMTMYINDPTIPSLAGDPYQSFGCLCHKNKQSSFISGTKKFVYVVQPCNVIAGTYRFSFYTDAHAFIDGENLITVKASLEPYVRPLAYEALTDFSLHPAQSIAWEFVVDPAMIESNDGTYVDKELRFRLSIDQKRYGAVPTFFVANSAGDCLCGDSASLQQYKCTTDADKLNSYDCRLNLGFCSLDPRTDKSLPLPSPNKWYVIVKYGLGQASIPNQVIPLSILISRFNFWRTPKPLTITASSCDYLARAPRLISTYLESQQMEYFSVAFGGNGLFSAYIENITSGNLQVLFGNGYMPAPNDPPTPCSDNSIVCIEGSQGCKLSTTCPVTWIAVKSISNRRNRPTSYKITSCSALNKLLTLGQSIPVDLPEQDKVDTSLDISRLTRAGFPMLVIFASVPDPAPLGTYFLEYNITSCSTCNGGFYKSTNCSGLNCTLAINVCELPDNYATLLSNVRITTFFDAGTGPTTFTLSARAVPIPAPTTLSSNTKTEVTTTQNNWISVSWTLAGEVLTADKGIQTSLVNYVIIEGGGASQKYTTYANGDCPRIFGASTATPLILSGCCTQPGTYSYAFFHLGILDVKYEFFPQLITQSRHSYLAWPAATAPAVTRVDLPALVDTPTVEPTVYSEVYATVPLGIAKYSTLIVFASGSTSLNANDVKVYINRNQQAGVGHGGCFSSEINPTLQGGPDGFNSTSPIFLCNTDTAGLWVGFENNLNTVQTAGLTLSVAQPVRIDLGRSTLFNTGTIGVNQQFYLAPRENSWSNRLYKVSITYDTTSTTLGMFYANFGAAAGPNGPCSGSIVSGPITTSVFEIKVPSCRGANGSYALPLPYYYFGVVAASFSSSYTILVEEEDQLALATVTNTQLTLGSSLTLQSEGNYFFTAGPTTNTSVAVVTVSNYEPAGPGQFFDIKIFRDGKCVSYAETFCSNPLPQICTNYVPACELKVGFVYHVVITQTGGSGATFTVQAQISNLPTTAVIYNYTTASYTDNTQFYSSSVQPHAFGQYKFSLPSDYTANFLRNGGTIAISLDSISCGGVDVFASEGSMAGPGCLQTTRCSTAGCNLLSFSQCSELINGVIRHDLDFHLFVRGKNPAQGDPISFRFKITRTNQHQMFPFRGLEKHLISPLSYFEDALPACPAKPATGLPACCTGTTGIAWYIPKTVYSFSVEGDQMLGISNFHRLHFRLIDDRVLTGTLTVYNSFPTFCASGPLNTENKGIVGTCIADKFNRNCTVNIKTPNCGLHDAHQFFFTIDPVPGALFQGGLPTNPDTYWPVYSLSHTHQPYDVVEVFYSEAPQYFRSTMALNEVSYYRITHLPNVNVTNYHFVVTVQQVIGGTVSVTNTWNECAAASCSDSDCRNYDAARPCTEFLPDCSCKVELLRCAAGEWAQTRRESSFQVTALSTSATTLVEVQLKITFIEVLTPQPDRTCDTLGCSEVLYHDTWKKDVSAEQLYRYRIKGVEGRTSMVVRDDAIALPGFPSDAHAVGCRQYRRCDAVGPELGYKQCEFYHRRPGTSLPYLTTNSLPSGTGECTRALSNFETLNHNRYNLELDLITPPIVTLADANLTDSTYYSGACQAKNESYYYKFTPTTGTYMVVELWSMQDPNFPAETLQLWVTPNHISFHIMNEAVNLGCITRTGLPNNVKYCRYLLICDYAPGTTYYIQVSDTHSIDFPHVDVPYFHHKIRASAMTHAKLDLTLGSGLNFVLPYDNRQITAIHIPTDGNTVNSEQDLEVFVKGNANRVDTWLTRSKFGGVPCSLSTGSGNASKLGVPHCHITDKGDVFIAHVIRVEGQDFLGAGVCTDSQVTVHARLSLEVDAVNATYQANTLGGTPTALRIQRLGQDFGAQGFLVKIVLPALGKNDIVYGRLSNYDHDAGLTLNLFKGNYIAPQDTTSYGVACSIPCGLVTQLPATNVAWGDKCWHCGTGVHGPVFARIDTTSQQQSVDALAVDLSVVVTSWVDLSAAFLPVTFPNAEQSLAFFTFVHTRVEGTRIDLDIITGASVEVTVYSDSCGLRVIQPTQYWCFKGVRCEIPVPKRANVGTYYRKTPGDSQYLDETLRIVVRGFDSSFQIRQVRGIDACEALTVANAPFCSRLPEISGSRFWGHDNANSFIAKDRNANEFYSNLTQAFTCSVTDACDCPPQTEACRTALAVYACQSIFNPCDVVGFETGPTYRQCRNVEFYCGRTFVCAGIPRLSCNHTFYNSGILPVDSLNFPTNLLDDPENFGFDNRRGGIIAAIVLLSLLAIIVLVAAAYILMSRASSLLDLSSEDQLGSYEAL